MRSETTCILETGPTSIEWHYKFYFVSPTRQWKPSKGWLLSSYWSNRMLFLRVILAWQRGVQKSRSRSLSISEQPTQKQVEKTLTKTHRTVLAQREMARRARTPATWTEKAPYTLGGPTDLQKEVAWWAVENILLPYRLTAGNRHSLRKLLICLFNNIQEDIESRN